MQELLVSELSAGKIRGDAQGIHNSASKLQFGGSKHLRVVYTDLNWHFEVSEILLFESIVLVFFLHLHRVELS